MTDLAYIKNYNGLEADLTDLAYIKNYNGVKKDLTDLAYIKNYNELKSAETGQTSGVTDPTSSETPAPLTNLQHETQINLDNFDYDDLISDNFSDDDTLRTEEPTESNKTPAHITSLLLDIQRDLTDLAYIKNYNNPENTETEQKLEIMNLTPFFLIQNNMDHILISEENLDLEGMISIGEQRALTGKEAE